MSVAFAGLKTDEAPEPKGAVTGARAATGAVAVRDEPSDARRRAICMRQAACGARAFAADEAAAGRTRNWTHCAICL